MSLSITCRRLCPAAAAAQHSALWLHALGAKPNTVVQETRRYSWASGEAEGEGATAGVPVRCLVAKRRIVRGERLCAVPSSLILDGRLADAELRRLAQLAARQAGSVSGPAPLRGYEEMVERLHEMPGTAGVPLLASRDALLVTAVLYLYRSPRFRSLWPRSALSAWVHTMPRRMPPLGLLLAEHLERGGQHRPLQRRLTLGDMTVPLLPGADAQEAATELMVAAVEAKGLAEGLRSPRTEVVLTAAMLADFHAGRHTALTPRQFEAAAAHTLRHSGSAAVKQLAALEAELQRDVLLPLLHALSPAFGNNSSLAASKEDWADVDGRTAGEELDAMRWAHFMLRSRAINVGFRRGPAALAVVPFLDRLNHSHTGANVTYAYSEDASGTAPAEVVVTASRAIGAGEELRLHYGHVGQRGCLFGDEPPEAEAGRSPGDPRQQRTDAVTRSVRSIEAKQRREMVMDEDSAEQAGAAPVFAVTRGPDDSRSGFSACGNDSRRGAAEQQAVREATWLWRYGFLRSEAERAAEASHLWSRGLRGRLARLTDVRRKGAPGTFVVGVPEGLEHLRQQRESLERERYGNARVFPPQQA